MEVNNLKIDIDLIHGEVLNAISLNLKEEYPVLITKMGQVMDGCFNPLHKDLGDREIKKLFQWICWSIRTEKSSLIRPVVYKAYKVMRYYSEISYLKEKREDISHEITHVYKFTELPLESVISKVLAGEIVTTTMFVECVQQGRLDILRFLYYSSAGKDVREEIKNGVLVKQAVIHHQARILEFLISEKFPIQIDPIKKDFSLEIHQYDLLLEDSFYHPESCEIAEILFPLLVRTNHYYPVFIRGEKQFIQTHFLEFISAYISPHKFAWYLDRFISVQEEIDLFNLFENIFAKAVKDPKRCIEMLRSIKKIAEKQNKPKFVAYISEGIKKYYLGTFHKEFLICLKDLCDPNDLMWIHAIQMMSLNIDKEKYSDFSNDFPFEVWGYRVSSGKKLLDVYQEVWVAGIFQPKEAEHWYKKFKTYCFKESQKCLQPQPSSLEYWKIGKELFNYNLIAHLGHKQGKMTHIFEKIIYVEDYEGFPPSRYMYKVLKKGYSQLCKSESGLFDKEIDDFLDLAVKELDDDRLSLIKLGRPYSVSSGYREQNQPKGHTIEILIFAPYLVICDLAGGPHNFKVYHMNKEKLTQKMLEDLVLQEKKSKQEMLLLLDAIVEDLECVLHPLCKYLTHGNSLIQKNQVVGNCVWASKEASWMFFNWLLKYKTFASEEEWSSGVLNDERLKQFFVAENIKEVAKIFQPSVSHGLLRFLDKQLTIIEKRENIVSPDWILFIKILIDPFYYPIKVHDIHYITMLAKVFRLAPYKEICLFIDQARNFIKNEPRFYARLEQAFYLLIIDEMKAGMDQEQAKEKHGVLLQYISSCMPLDSITSTVDCRLQN